MLNRLKKYGVDLAGSIFNADNAIFVSPTYRNNLPKIEPITGMN